MRSTHRSLEGLGYLGMLSATPTDMGVACFKRPMSGSEKPFCYYPRLPRDSYDEEAAVGKILTPCFQHLPALNGRQRLMDRLFCPLQLCGEGGHDLLPYGAKVGPVGWRD